MGKKKRIALGDPKRRRWIPNPLKLEAPTTPLQEFRSWGKIEVKPCTPCGPKMKGYACVASWDVVPQCTDEADFMGTWENLESDPVRLFHGTVSRNVAAITRNGLRRGRSSCMFGAGIYFGLLQKAMGFARGGDACYIFEADVLLGKTHVAERAQRFSLKDLKNRGCHSVHGKAGVTKSWGSMTLRLDEWVIYSRTQILLDKLHEYQPTEAEWTPQEVSGRCALVIQKDVPLTKKSRAFRDLISQQPCGRTGYTQLRISRRYGTSLIWVCNTCIKRDKLRVGSKVQVKGTYGRYEHCPVLSQH